MNERLLKILDGETKFYPAALESTFPRILDKIMLLWGTPAIEIYFTQLMVTDRPNRAGFPPEIAAEIMRLSLIHASKHASAKKPDVWDIPTDKFANFQPQASMYVTDDWKQLPASTKQAIENFGIT